MSVLLAVLSVIFTVAFFLLMCYILLAATAWLYVHTLWIDEAVKEWWHGRHNNS